MRYTLLLPFFIFVLVLNAQSSLSLLPEWTEDEIIKANTGANIPYLTPEEKEIILLTNLVRINPLKFSRTYLEKYLNESEMERSSWYVTGLQTTLSTMSALHPLKPSKKLCSAAAFHAEDMGRTGKIGHTSSDGTPMDTRLYRYVPKAKVKALSENCQYGYKNPFSIFMDLLVDEGIESLGHRLNILDPDMEYIGVAIRPHSTYRINCVQDFGAVMR